jgi:hypothetical protein
MKNPSIPQKLKREILRLRLVPPILSKKYYQLSLFANENGGFSYCMTSKWVAFTETTPRREIRQASLVDATKAVAVFRSIGEPLAVINKVEDLRVFVSLFGGHAVVESSLAKKYLSDLLKPSVFTYSFSNGFQSIDAVPKEKLDRAPTKTSRMKILNRDGRSCRICGSSPADNVHVQLELHHVIPFAYGGLTDEKNLITLCHACHAALDPKVDYSLFARIGIDMLSDRKDTVPYAKRIAKNLASNMGRLQTNEKSS